MFPFDIHLAIPKGAPPASGFLVYDLRNRTIQRQSGYSKANVDLIPFVYWLIFCSTYHVIMFGLDGSTSVCSTSYLCELHQICARFNDRNTQFM